MGGGAWSKKEKGNSGHILNPVEYGMERMGRAGWVSG